MERWGRGLLASCSLLYPCLVGAGHGRPAAVEAAGACTPKLSYSMGNVTCYGPAQVAQAERRLPRPPLRPVAAVWRVAHLPLDQVDAMQPLSPTQHYGNASGPVVSLDYLFGPPTPAALYSTDPPPSHPAFVVVHEAIGSIADIGDVQLDRGSYSGSGGSGYDAWDLTANIPGRPLYLHITSNQGAATLIRIAAEVVGRTIRCGAVSGGPVQTRRCAYAAAGVSAPSSVDGPLLFTGRTPGEPGVTLFAAQPMQAPRVLVREIPDDTIVAPSPRGRYIALAEREHGLWLVDSDGSGLHRLLLPPPPRPGPTGSYDIGAVAWSPDRYTIAYAIVQPLGYPLYPPAPRGKPDGIWLVRYDGGPPRQLATNAQLGVDGVGRLSFSSDGRTLAAVAYSGRTAHDVATDVATGRVEPLLGTVINVNDVQFSPCAGYLGHPAHIRQPPGHDDRRDVSRPGWARRGSVPRLMAVAAWF